MKKSDELKKYSGMKKADLIKEAANLKKQSVLMSLKVRAGKYNVNSDSKKLKKNLARVLTILNNTEDNNG